MSGISSLRTVFRATMAVLRRLLFLFALGPALLHHLGDALTRSSTHVTPGALGHILTSRRSAPTTVRAKSFQRSNGSFNTLTLCLKVSEYILNIHASPFIWLQTRG